MTLQERADAYSARFPHYPVLWVDKGWLMGVWLIGRLYARGDRTIYGGYPGNYLKRVLALFPDHGRRLDLFAGNTPKVPGAVRVDIDPDRHPDYVADAAHLPFEADSFDFVLADPPYSATDARRYGPGGEKGAGPYKMVVRREVMHEVRRVVTDGAWLCWLDTVRPMYRRQDWAQVGAVAVMVSTNTRTRMLSIFRAVPRDGRVLEDVEPEPRRLLELMRNDEPAETAETRAEAEASAGAAGGAASEPGQAATEA